jgi:hypothetical protein
MKSLSDSYVSGGYKGNKYPKLDELYEKLFDENIEYQYDALDDLRARAASFWRLKDLEIVDKSSQPDPVTILIGFPWF